MRSRLLFVLCLISTLCQAQEVKNYQLSKKKDLKIGATCLALGIADLVLENRLKPLTDADIQILDANDLPFFDRSAPKQNSVRAKNLSDVFEYGVFLVPAPLFFSAKARGEAKEIATMYFEAFSINVLSTQFVKYVVRRNRPFMYNESVDINLKRTTNGRKSFYSGHVSHTATLSIFTAKVFSDLYPESKWKTIVWTTAFAIPATTGYLRYKAGRHFPSDNVAGIVVGSLIGYFVPQLHRLEVSIPEELSLNTTNSGLALTYSF